MPPRKQRASTQTVTATERLFKAAFGREMTATERRRFIWEKPVSLEELARRKERDVYAFLRQT
jgi:hypothetical protein